MAEGKLYTWGKGGNGQLGHGGKEDSAVPREVPQRLNVVSCAHFHSVGISPAGQAYSWGRGALGLLGHGDEVDHVAPKRIESLAKTPLEAVGCGPYHSAAVSKDGAVFAWGWALVPGKAQLEETFHVSPMRLPVLDKVRVAGVACGCYATAVWTADGVLLTWGRGGSGQLGHGTTNDEAAPKPVAALKGVQVAQVAMGGMQAQGFLLARSADGRLFSCGATDKGRLGRPAVAAPLAGSVAVGGNVVPFSVPGALALNEATAEGGALAAFAVDVAAADHHAAAVGHTGVLFVWGSNDFARLGLTGVAEAAAPTAVTSLGAMRVRGVACSAYATAALVANGTLFTFGGKPDAATPTDALATPAPLELPEAASAVAGGGYHLAALVGAPPPAGQFAGLKLGAAAAAAHAAPAVAGAVDLPAALRGVVSDELVELLPDMAGWKKGPSWEADGRPPRPRHRAAPACRRLSTLSRCRGAAKLALRGQRAATRPALKAPMFAACVAQARGLPRRARAAAAPRAAPAA